MIDAELRRYIDPPLIVIAKNLRRTRLSANQITITGFLIGLLSVPLLASHQYNLALMAILFNRFFDGLDGAVARDQGITDFGGYLDIVLDFIFYSAVIFGFCLALPDQALYGAFLIFSFIGTGSSFLAMSIFAAKRSIVTSKRGKKAFYYLGGLTEGFETILVMVILCLYPQSFWLVTSVFGCLCWITTGTRILVARNLLM